MNLALVDRVAEQSLANLAQELTQLGVRAIDVTADVTVPADRAALLAESERELGPIDILINNAAIIEWTRFVEQDTEHIDRIIETNLLAPMHLGRMILPSMVERRSGHVVNHASLNGKRGIPFDAV